VLEGKNIVKGLEEARLHGRGGHGVVMCAELIAQAAVYDGKFARSFPWFIAARRGAPVAASLIIGDPDKITRSMVYNPKYVLVLDPRLHRVMPEVTKGIMEGGTYIQNSTKTPAEILKELKLDVKLKTVATLDATGLAREHMGIPIPNIAMVGAFAKVTNLITLDSARKAVKARFSEELWERYLKCLEAGYENVRVEVIG